MATQRCEKHGVFSGNVGCPWCKAEQESRIAGTKTERKGVTVISKRGPEDPSKGTIRESKHEGGSRETEVEIGIPGENQIRTSYGQRRHL